MDSLLSHEHWNCRTNNLHIHSLGYKYIHLCLHKPRIHKSRAHHHHRPLRVDSNLKACPSISIRYFTHSLTHWLPPPHHFTHSQSPFLHKGSRRRRSTSLCHSLAIHDQRNGWPSFRTIYKLSRDCSPNPPTDMMTMIQHKSHTTASRATLTHSTGPWMIPVCAGGGGGSRSIPPVPHHHSRTQAGKTDLHGKPVLCKRYQLRRICIGPPTSRRRTTTCLNQQHRGRRTGHKYPLCPIRTTWRGNASRSTFPFIIPRCLVCLLP